MKNRFFCKCLSLLMTILLLVPAACASAVEAEGSIVGVNDTGFTFCGLDMGDRSLTREEILKAIAEQTGMEPQQFSDIEWVIPGFEVRPVCLGGHAGMTSVMLEEIDGVLFWGTDTLVLPETGTSAEDFYSYVTADRIFEDSMEMLAEIYGAPDEVALTYWDPAEEDMVTFKLVNEDFFSAVWSMVEQSQYGNISATYGNATVRLQREMVDDAAIHTCWLYLGAYEE